MKKIAALAEYNMICDQNSRWAARHIGLPGLPEGPKFGVVFWFTPTRTELELGTPITTHMSPLGVTMKPKDFSNSAPLKSY